MKPRGHNLDQSASGDTIRGSSSVALKVKVVCIIPFDLIRTSVYSIELGSFIWAYLNGTYRLFLQLSV